MSIAVAIVGGGPAGLYTAEALRKTCPGCRIDIIERFPTPFGLVRYGVAPDHQTTKNVARVFERVLDQPHVRLLGNVELGRDVGYDDLKEIYDAVVLSMGAQDPRGLGIPGEEAPGVVDIVDMVGWYNGMPGARDCSAEVRAARAAVVIGNGNVALDVARLLAKTDTELAASDITPTAAAAIAAAPLEDIYLIGRRGPAQANFTFPELNEFGELSRAVTLVDADRIPSDDALPEGDARKKAERNFRSLRIYSKNRPDAKPLRLHLMFFAAPVEILTDGAVTGAVTGVRLERTRLEEGRAVGTGEFFDLEAQLVVPAIGYRVKPIAGIPVDARRGIVVNSDGRVEPGVYVVGWAKRGPSGVIGTNRVDARAVVETLAADTPMPGKPGPAAMDALLAKAGVRPVSAAEWRRIDAAERARAKGDRPREKFTRVEDMLDVLLAPVD